jgi:hypothetical protein
VEPAKPGAAGGNAPLARSLENRRGVGIIPQYVLTLEQLEAERVTGGRVAAIARLAKPFGLGVSLMTAGDGGPGQEQEDQESHSVVVAVRQLKTTVRKGYGRGNVEVSK